MHGRIEQPKVQSVLELLDSHTHYEYCRSLFRGDLQVMDPMIQKPFDFVEKVCSVSVLMSLLITVMRDDTTDEAQTVPVSKLQLYDLAMSVILGRWNPSRADLTRTVLARIARRMALEYSSLRVSTASTTREGGIRS